MQSIVARPCEHRQSPFADGLEDDTDERHSKRLANNFPNKRKCILTSTKTLVKPFYQETSHSPYQTQIAKSVKLRKIGKIRSGIRTRKLITRRGIETTARPHDIPLTSASSAIRSTTSAARAGSPSSPVCSAGT